MKSFAENIKKFWNSRWGFFFLAVVLFWIKTYYAYTTKFNLGISGGMQHLLALLNPLPTTILLFGIALYFKGRKSYVILLIIDFLTTFWLFANILYYREFSDFLTTTLIKGSGSVSNNLGKSVMGIIEPTDFLVFVDVIVLILLLVFRIQKIDIKPLKKTVAGLVTVLSVVFFGFNLTAANADRSGLLTRTFDNNYIVKYLGLNSYAVYDVVKSAKTSAVRANANASDMKTVEKYIKANHVPGNPTYTGVAKGKNVFIIHLESLQQFVIDYKVDGQEVTPNLNRIYHESNTLSFDNFYNQVGQGKTADAELMLENSLFGLSEGAAMVTAGTANTWQAAPAILSQQQGYTTAAFHGDVPSFWNRDNTYKSWGYDYYFSKSYFQSGESFDVGYGLKDKIFLKDSMKYIEQLPQPFYAKLITVTNHYPYLLDKANQSIPKTTTGDKTVDGYVQTAHYLDQAIGEFMAWLKATGLDKNSLLVFYGDHYAISGNHKPAIAKLLDQKKATDFDVAQWQRVPLMIHMDGLKGGINHTYGGEIDVLPTLENLLGINNENYIQFGNDLLAGNRNQTVAFYNGDFISPEYTRYAGKTYKTSDGSVVKNPDAATKKTIETLTNHVATELSLSRSVINGDLLRFYTPKGFKKVVPKDYSYKLSTALKNLKKMQKKQKTSLLVQNKNKSSLDLYKTDAPELKSESTEDGDSSEASSHSSSSSSSSHSQSSSSSEPADTK
ncbi:sulfatase [Lapidilactobacillus concavus DSM 17758]|jgi:lipoteichoic acid synthase|uniref:Sulfatase n=1 Tax=Lapidilactobacillus concavus DSM 17758 TaxID=1423735 RepID=A0A0R1W5Q8_9LACO|nr:LTA synthase family protein [Lapidilactobacillus concavus]KRM12893.1 sulfatase [Lapidilactobacillus concavus DSM 17758]GEL13218.1 glycerol phosphate lipoteichoic acid synthase [Lapidilactobacillus concavus]